MIDEFYQRQARKVIPKGYFQLTKFDSLRASDLVWSFSSQEWLQADSPLWAFDSFLIPMDEIICAIRKAELENFGEVKKVYTVKRETQGSLF